jgi:hypothetical protein
MVEEPLNGRNKVFQLDWLALVRIEPRVRDPLPILGHYRRGHGHDGNPSSGLSHVDDLVIEIMRRGGLNPKFFTGSLSPRGREALEYQNSHASAWLR